MSVKDASWPSNLPDRDSRHPSTISCTARARPHAGNRLWLRGDQGAAASSTSAAEDPGPALEQPSSFRAREKGVGQPGPREACTSAPERRRARARAGGTEDRWCKGEHQSEVPESHAKSL
eukprot:scaffold24429_cov56-Isochrysis_galbana.AAC.1